MVGFCPACVIVIVREIPLTLTVTVPVRGVGSVFAVALILNEPFPVVFVGVALEKVSHVTLLEKLHLRLDVTLTVRLLDTALKFAEVAFTVSVAAGAAACVTVTVRESPPPVTVTVAPRWVWFGLAVAFILNELPVILEIVSQAALLETPQVALDVTVIVLLFAPDPQCIALVDTESV